MPITFAEPIIGYGTGSARGPLPGSGLAVPAGVEAVLEYDGLYLNVTNNVDRYKVKTIDGFDDADMRDMREDNPGDDGETAYPSFYSGRPISLTGTIQAYTLEKMRDMIMALQIAFSNIRVEKPLIIHGRTVPQKVFINCRKNGKIAVQETQSDMRFFRDFLIPLRASNFRIMSLERPAMTVSGLNAGAASVMSITNLGSYPAQCQIILQGGMTEPRVTNLTNASMVKFEPGTVLPSATSKRDISSFQGERWVKDENGNNKYNEITIDSTWVTLEPGVNNIEFYASAISGVAGDRKLTIYWRHTWK
jgi:hypothetical protein